MGANQSKKEVDTEDKLMSYVTELAQRKEVVKPEEQEEVKEPE